MKEKKENKNIKSKKIKIFKKKNDKVIKKTEKRTATFSLTEMIVVVVVVALVVSILSGYLVFKNYGYILEQTVKENDSSELTEFINIYKELKEKYVEDVDSDELIDAAIDGMLNYLDVYTDYLDKDTTTNLQDRLNGEYKGIGVEISNNTDGNVYIVNIFENTPAEAAGLKSGDVITAINGESVLGKTSSDVASAIKESSETLIKLTYKRNNVETTVNINLSNIIIPSVNHEVLEGKIGYVKLSTFSSTSYTQVKEALNKLGQDKITSLIVDLRDNTGGYLESAKNISDLFIEKDKVIYRLKYKDGTVKKFYSKTAAKTSYPIVVLINESSASAAEILAAALKETYGATLVGAKSFGKGTVQETEILSNGSMIKYTSAYWLTPKGNSINKIGLDPDILVSNTSTNTDDQLKAAIEALK